MISVTVSIIHETAVILASVLALQLCSSTLSLMRLKKERNILSQKVKQEKVLSKTEKEMQNQENESK